ncbi:rhodanese-like domain-containing protein [Polaribacter sp. R77954]|uniref:rhodanese-like domain-containing protein n=1 Tax=Polaribacter sp. R77954 TaxID=3093870 RepID=UPI0037C5F401
MKELEKTKRISIATTLFILAVLIGLFTFKRPKNTFAHTTKNTLEKISDQNYLTSISEMNNPKYIFIDIRNAYEFEKGSLKNAINIHTPDFLAEENLEVFKELKNTEKTMVLYGKNPEEVNLPFLLLYQLGFDNVKLLAVELDYVQNILFTKKTTVEVSKNNIAAFINTSRKNTGINAKITKKPVQKKIIVRQKKKKAAEGGC